MKRTWVAGALLLLLPLASAPAEAQNTCTSGQWADVSGSTTIRPENDEYRGRITFSRQPGCPVGCPDSTSTQATFEVLNPPPWLKGNFTQNPAPINGSAQPLAARTTQNDLVLQLDRTAPVDTSFTVRVRARCSQTSEVTKTFRVGSLVNVTADVIRAAVVPGGAEWIIRISNGGNVPMRAEFQPNPTDQLVWDVPEGLVVPKPEGEFSSVSASANISVRGDAIPKNLTVTLRLSEDNAPSGDPIEIALALPYTVFSGSSTPSVPLGWTLLGLVLLVAARRR